MSEDYTAQNDWLLAELKKGQVITNMYALHHGGIFRLSARIFELRKQGWPIITEFKKIAKRTRIAEYTMGWKG